MRYPAEDGFAMPAEWEPQARCWMAWPCRGQTWGDQLGAARQAYAEVAQAIGGFEPVTMVARPKQIAEVSLVTGVSALPLPIDDSWLRDNGPTFVRNAAGEVAGVHWRWNAWGGKYAEHERDAEVAQAILDHLKMRRYAASFVLEGGAIHSDGQGTVLTTESVLLNPNRNPGMTKADMEEQLGLFLGARKVIWLGQGLKDDDTDGHVDNLACFVRPGVVMALTTSDTTDDNYAALADNLARLRAATDAAGRSLEIIEVEQPRPRLGRDGRRMTMSYINFFIANDAVIVPAFEDPQDRRAFEACAKAFPDRQVVQVPASDIVYGGGGIHCITQQQPAGPPTSPA
ncbi:MAG: agmatine deiminase family protein [Rhodospirillaceae bacterium]|nr:agmatine deiminase family protein [Rhodospirillaceae bacterium]